MAGRVFVAFVAATHFTRVATTRHSRKTRNFRSFPIPSGNGTRPARIEPLGSWAAVLARLLESYCVMNSIQILLVEDNEIDAMAFQRGMKRHNLTNTLVIAENGVEALEILKGTHAEKTLQRPYLIFLDLNMPMMGGLELLEEIRKDDDLDISTVFILTTSDHDADLLAAYKHHVAGYILKKSVADAGAQVHELLQRYDELVLLPGKSAGGGWLERDSTVS